MLDSVSTVSDSALISAVREGSTKDFELLYQRHSVAARRFALHLTSNPVEADDLVAEAFARVLSAIRARGGPTAAFRSYLMVTLRNVSHEQFRKNRKVTLSDDMTEFDDGYTPDDSVMLNAERSMIAAAYTQLPERWRAVLWHTEIEGSRPADIAHLLGLTPNGVAALAYRAREGLRQAYLQAHLAAAKDSCQATVARLGAWTRTGLSARETAQVEAHLDTCERCRGLAAELTDLNHTLAAKLGPVMLGATYWTWSASNTATPVVLQAQPLPWLAAVGSTAALATSVVFGVSAIAPAQVSSAAMVSETSQAPRTPGIPTTTTTAPQATTVITSPPPAPTTTPMTTISQQPLVTSTKPAPTTTTTTPTTVTTPPVTTPLAPPRANWSVTGNTAKASTSISARNLSGTAKSMTLEITPPEGAVIQSTDPRCNVFTSLVTRGVRCTATVQPGETFTTTAWVVGREGALSAVLTSGTDVVRTTITK